MIESGKTTGASGTGGVMNLNAGQSENVVGRYFSVSAGQGGTIGGKINLLLVLVMIILVV